MNILWRLKLAFCILLHCFWERQKAYRVVWSRPNYSCAELEAGRFFAQSEAEALNFFRENFQENQRYRGDFLILYRVVVKEEVVVVTTVEAKIIIGDE